MSSDGIAEAVHRCKRPDQQDSLKDYDRGDPKIKEDLELVWSDPDQRK